MKSVRINTKIIVVGIVLFIMGTLFVVEAVNEAQQINYIYLLTLYGSLFCIVLGIFLIIAPLIGKMKSKQGASAGLAAFGIILLVGGLVMYHYHSIKAVSELGFATFSYPYQHLGEILVVAGIVITVLGFILVFLSSRK